MIVAGMGPKGRIILAAAIGLCVSVAVAILAVTRLLSPDNSNGADSEKGVQPLFTLQLLHTADMDGSSGALENVAVFSALIDGFRRQYPDNTLVLSGGDNFVQGPRYFGADDEAHAEVLGLPGNGRGDIALLNAMGFQASAIGNHELDRGPFEFASIIAPESDGDGSYEGAAFPYLASNLVLADDENLQSLVVPDAQPPTGASGSLAGSVIISVGGERIGVVGVTTPLLAQLAETGDITVSPTDGQDLDALAAIVQNAVDELVAKGLNKVILLAHLQQIALEMELATKLTDVDIIVAGGSNTILADAIDRTRPGDKAAHTYPIQLRSADGSPVLLVNTDGDYRYLGRLVVDFDDDGLLLPESIDPTVSGAHATDKHHELREDWQPNARVAAIARSLRATVRERGSNALGRTAVYLGGRRATVRSQETNLGNIVADANLWFARQVDPEVAVSLQNGGGIRAEIGTVVQPPGTTSPADVIFSPPAAIRDDGAAANVTQFHVESTLRFNNGLVIVLLSAHQLVEVLEHAVGFDGAGQTPAGQFPQVGGMRLSFDPERAAGQRIRSLAVVGNDGEVVDRVVEAGAIVGEGGRVIKVVTLNYIANGGDGFPFRLPAEGRIDLAGEAGQPNPPDPDFPDTNGNGVIDGPTTVDPGRANFAAPGTEQDVLAEYLAHFYSDSPFDQAESPPLEDLRVQNLAITGNVDRVFRSQLP